MRADRIAVILAGVAVAASVIAGLWLTGGPMQGRAERRNEVRYQDLLDLRSQAVCLARARGDVLPERLEEAEGCRFAERYADPYTQAAYVYEKLSETGFRLCAGFEPGEWRYVPPDFDTKSGCLISSFVR